MRFVHLPYSIGLVWPAGKASAGAPSVPRHYCHIRPGRFHLKPQGLPSTRFPRLISHMLHGDAPPGFGRDATDLRRHFWIPFRHGGDQPLPAVQVPAFGRWPQCTYCYITLEFRVSRGADKRCSVAQTLVLLLEPLWLLWLLIR